MSYLLGAEEWRKTVFSDFLVPFDTPFPLSLLRSKLGFSEISYSAKVLRK